MIAALRGSVLSVEPTVAVIEAGGVGYAVQATPATLAGLRVGQEAFVHTSLVVREDSMTLFGFADADEREVFDVLQTVSGVGPKLALTILATLTPDQLRQAVANADIAALTRVSGVGKKGAQRLVLEIGAKLGPRRGGDLEAPSSNARSGDVVAALVGLGFSERDAESAFSQVEKATPEAEVPELLRASLKILGAGR
ncbi:Holliday junction DNA helicase RuvA [Peptidiphaga gingivicola]|uniref:Holliday junction branch migration complex subunit RuvA n=1 Tax=Peptidiphaga gingivicola TaxID=2741497 RepID=A0A179B0D1_9ACTO|nr:Holliday junction branch migration protein RuvA [Peptidiphaga gingivicola]OAP85168.1 Holliday junction DNA helicase RuvA [Peptidiphaga gingivicola]